MEANELDEIKKELEAIRHTIQQLPELNAVIFLQFYEKYESAKLIGRKTSDLWKIEPPTQL